MKITIPDPMKDYTVNKEIIFFSLGDRVSLADLKKVFTLTAIASLISEDFVTRDCNVIKADKKDSPKEIIKASDDLIDWVEAEYIETVGNKFRCKILSNGYVAIFKFVK